MIRLELAGPHTRILSTLCAQCPFGPLGCCAGPPDFDWSDIGRVVSLGGRDWLLDQIGKRNLSPVAHGLWLRRVKKRTSINETRRSRCVHHGPTGCTLSADRRPATCNYFVCEEVFVEGAAGGGRAESLASRQAHAGLMEAYSHCDREVGTRMSELWPEGVVWNALFLEWLGSEYDHLVGGACGALASEGQAKEGLDPEHIPHT